MKRRERIKKIIQEARSIDFVNVIDNSAAHHGHTGIDPKSSATHLMIELQASDFEGMSRVARERILNELMQQEFNNGLHALQFKFI